MEYILMGAKTEPRQVRFLDYIRSDHIVRFTTLNVQAYSIPASKTIALKCKHLFQHRGHIREGEIMVKSVCGHNTEQRNQKGSNDIVWVIDEESTWVSG